MTTKKWIVYVPKVYCQRYAVEADSPGAALVIVEESLLPGSSVKVVEDLGLEYSHQLSEDEWFADEEA
jgi:hypothetical protein